MRQVLAVFVLVMVAGLLHGETRNKAILLSVNDAIGPAITDYIERGLDRASDDGANIVIIQLDTPGGLDLAMRSIIRAIIASPVPVAIYVAPPGARAASAGTYMMYAAHVAAMAPGTNLGAATPVQMGGMPGMDPPEKPAPGAADDDTATDETNTDEEAPATTMPGNADAMTKKIVNDAAAYIRSLAEMRGRNAEWAVQAVREAASLSSEQALDAGVIDIIARDTADLLQQVNGRTVTVQDRDWVLDTNGLVLETIEPDWRNELLAIITNPNITYILMLLGIYGLFFRTGQSRIRPARRHWRDIIAARAVCTAGPAGELCRAGTDDSWDSHSLSENYSCRASASSGIGGVISFVMGSILLFDRESGNLAVSMPLIIAVSVLSAGFFLIVIRALHNARRRPVVTGAEELIGATGQVIADFSGDRHNIHIHGEQWHVRSDTPMRSGDSARVISRDGLILHS